MKTYAEVNNRVVLARRILVRAACLALAAVLPLLSGCIMYVASEMVDPADPAANAPTTPIDGGGQQLAITSEQVTLAWDAPGGPPVVSYTLYYRTHGDSLWTSVGTAPAAQPEFTVTHGQLGDGDFDFGVVAVYASDVSQMHTSLDSTADPTTGWYLRWQQ